MTLDTFKKKEQHKQAMIMLVGESGSGKSFALRNLPPEQSVIFNIERKPLPFNFEKFQYIVQDELEIPVLETKIKAALSVPEFKYIVIDSFTKYWEKLEKLCKKIYSGYDIYGKFQEKVFDFFEMLKTASEKCIILTAIPEHIDVMKPSGGKETVTRVAIEGKRWSGKIEKEFAVVVYLANIDDQKEVNRYKFYTKKVGTISAKSPPGLLLPEVMENDIAKICFACEKLWGF